MNTKLLEWVLRISVAGEYIGHGVFALRALGQLGRAVGAALIKTLAEKF